MSDQTINHAKVVGFLQARVTSSRLPGKVLKPILGKPMLARQIERLLRCRNLDQLVVLTSTESSDDPIAELCSLQQVKCFRGSLNDVLDRFWQGAQALSPGAKWIVRLTGDSPLTDPSIIDHVIDTAIRGDFDYVCNFEPPTYPDGLDVEVMKRSALEAAWSEAVKPSEREHVTPFIRNHPERFKKLSVSAERDLSSLRWTVDEPQDFELVRTVYERLYPVKPDFTWMDVLDLVNREPALSDINSGLIRNEGYLISLKKDEASSE